MYINLSIRTEIVQPPLAAAAFSGSLLAETAKAEGIARMGVLIKTMPLVRQKYLRKLAFLWHEGVFYERTKKLHGSGKHLR